MLPVADTEATSPATLNGSRGMLTWHAQNLRTGSFVNVRFIRSSFSWSDLVVSDPSIFRLDDESLSAAESASACMPPYNTVQTDLLTYLLTYLVCFCSTITWKL